MEKGAVGSFPIKKTSKEKWREQSLYLISNLSSCEILKKKVFNLVRLF